MPSRVASQLMVNCTTHIFFALGLVFFQAAFLGMYVPGYKWERWNL